MDIGWARGAAARSGVPEIHMIELVLDFVSINAYLALNPAKRLADEFGVGLKLTPLRTTSELHALAEPSDSDDIGERHRWIRADYARRDALRYAAVQGLNIAIDGRDQDSTTALQGLIAANAAGKGFDYASTVFQNFWAGELQIEKDVAIVSLLEELGVADFDVTDSRWNLEPIRDEMNTREIHSVPTFYVEGERYLGRQHLPMIRWQLEGYEGSGPL